MSLKVNIYKSLLGALKVRGNCNILRNYASACWNCQHQSQDNHMICKACGFLQDVNNQLNYFELLNFPVGYSLPATELTRNFRRLQTLVHPDKFSNKSEREQCNSAAWSSLINKAYKTLSTPIERGRYLLQVSGHKLPQDNSAVDKELLLEMMERNEQVEEATGLNELTALQQALTETLNECALQLSRKFEAQNYEEANKLLIRMKYLQSVQQSIKNKLETLKYEN